MTRIKKALNSNLIEEYIMRLTCPEDFGLNDFRLTGKDCSHGQDDETCERCWNEVIKDD